MHKHRQGNSKKYSLTRFIAFSTFPVFFVFFILWHSDSQERLYGLASCRFLFDAPPTWEHVELWEFGITVNVLTVIKTI